MLFITSVWSYALEGGSLDTGCRKDLNININHLSTSTTYQHVSLCSAITAGAAAWPLLAKAAKAEDAQGVASSRMSYSRFLVSPPCLFAVVDRVLFFEAQSAVSLHLKPFSCCQLSTSHTTIGKALCLLIALECENISDAQAFFRSTWTWAV